MRFGQIFWLLMLAGTASALFLPSAPERAKGKLDILFVPISAPVRGMGLWVHDRFASKSAPVDDQGNAQTAEALKIENENLRNSVLGLKTQLDNLLKDQAELNTMRDLAPFCEPFKVVGGDSAGRQSLMIASKGVGTMLHLAEQQPVLTPEGLVGRIEHVGPGEARVRLVSDRNFHTTVTFARFSRDALEILSAPPTAIQGDGKGKMVITQLSLEQVKQFNLQIGDRARLDDNDSWPKLVQGQSVGRISSIGPDARHPKFAEIVVTPIVDAAQLREVMVLDKGQ